MRSSSAASFAFLPATSKVASERLDALALWRHPAVHFRGHLHPWCLVANRKAVSIGNGLNSCKYTDLRVPVLDLAFCAH
jgi:hypothetical protein